MNGVDVTDSVFNIETNQIVIQNVTTLISITAEAYSPVTHDWILSDGIGQINTGFVPTGTDIKVVSKFNVEQYLNAGTWLRIMGAYTGEQYNAYRITRFNNSTTSFYVMCGAKANSGKQVSAAINTTYQMEMVFNKITLNGTSTTLTTTTGTANTAPFFIASPSVKVKMWSLQIYKGNVLKVDLVPTSIGDVACMKDNVSGEYLFPSSSGFTVGDDDAQN